MDHALLNEVYRTARVYHGALAQYAAAMRAGGDIEAAAQAVVGTSLHYRVALDKLAAAGNSEEGGIVARSGRLERMRRIMETASRRYNIVKRAARLRRADRGADLLS